MNIDKISQLAQLCYEANPTLVLGSGASMDHGLPSMDDLKEHLLDKVTPDDGDEAQKWLEVTMALAKGNHLEEALEGKPIPESLIDKIVIETWKCVCEKDKQLFMELSNIEHPFPLGNIVKGLFRSSNNLINIVTTNYDRVVEYACNSAGIICLTGFTPGYFQDREGVDKLRILLGKNLTRTVRVWKVHGSLDWFSREDDTIIGLPVFEFPKGKLVPQIVTPGLNKFRRTHQEPFRSSISGADIALERASGYLCVGFGFRDPQIEPKLIERCRKDNIPVVVLARVLTDEAKSFLRDKSGTKYLGIEKAGNGSRVYCDYSPDGERVDEPNLWSLERFSELVT